MGSPIGLSAFASEEANNGLNHWKRKLGEIRPLWEPRTRTVVAADISGHRFVAEVALSIEAIDDKEFAAINARAGGNILRLADAFHNEWLANTGAQTLIEKLRAAVTDHAGIVFDDRVLARKVKGGQNEDQVKHINMSDKPVIGQIIVTQDLGVRFAIRLEGAAAALRKHQNDERYTTDYLRRELHAVQGIEFNRVVKMRQSTEGAPKSTKCPTLPINTWDDTEKPTIGGSVDPGELAEMPGIGEAIESEDDF